MLAVHQCDGCYTLLVVEVSEFPPWKGFRDLERCDSDCQIFGTNSHPSFSHGICLGSSKGIWRSAQHISRRRVMLWDVDCPMTSLTGLEHWQPSWSIRTTVMCRSITWKAWVGSFSQSNQNPTYRTACNMKSNSRLTLGFLTCVFPISIFIWCVVNIWPSLTLFLVKLYPPVNLSVEMNKDPELNLYWNNSKNTACIESEVRYRINSDKWKVGMGQDSGVGPLFGHCSLLVIFQQNTGQMFEKTISLSSTLSLFLSSDIYSKQGTEVCCGFPLKEQSIWVSSESTSKQHVWRVQLLEWMESAHSMGFHEWK